MNRTLVIGGTGAMGSRVVAQLLADTDDEVTVLTRNPDSKRAAALADGSDRVRLVRGDAGDPQSIRSALDDVSWVFCNTDFFSTKSPIAEFTQGTSILEAARLRGIDRFVWSSLDSAATLTAGRILVPHYEAKAAVAAHIQLHRSEEMMRHERDGWYSEHVSVLVTSPYFENLQSRLSPAAEGDEHVVFTLPLGSGRYPMIGLDDIAWFAVHMLEHWQSWGARDLAVAADSLTGNEIAATFERVTGIPARYAELPLDALRTGTPEVGHDYAGMFGFFQHYDLAGNARDLDLLRRLHPTLMTFENWLRRTGWDGGRREVQQFTPELSP
ncbi:NmrA family NAD(P)-binding protein [Sciscionella marina]|uniref:NmrA family NAD(P)-binding protein n=1 Tax=Sciscionella marina TaxID=508770 RepID=UPI00035C991D|nr:NmrA family NAD(P)-binding protein [Sciscionella marina]